MGEQLANNNIGDGELASPNQQQQPFGWLVNNLYKVDWNPLVEHRRYITMEGHLEILDEKDKEPEWKRLYFRTKDGRFQWFASHCADEHPISDILLTGAQVEANKDEWTMHIRGGKENARLCLRVPSNVWEKWHQVLLSHTSSTLVDAYSQPVWPPVPHRTNRVLLLEIGENSIRAGILTQRPSLPHIFCPAQYAIGPVEQNGQQTAAIIGPEILASGRQLSKAIIQSENGLQIDEKAVLELLKAVQSSIVRQASSMDIQFRMRDYLVLLSVPHTLKMDKATNILKMLLDSVFEFKAVSIVHQPSLVLYSYDVTTGIVVDLGEHFSIVPIIDEFIVDDAIVAVPFCSRNIRQQLRKKIELPPHLVQNNTRQDNDEQLAAEEEELILRFLVEKACFVAAQGFEEERTKGTAKEDKVVEMELAGKRVAITVDGETRYSVTEGLFKPKLWGLEETGGLHRLVYEAIQRCPIDIRRPLYRTIYLTGGTSLLPGLAERLEREFAKLVPQNMPVQVLNSPWRRHSAYLGAHPIAANPDFQNSCATLANLDAYLRKVSLSCSSALSTG